MINEKYLNKATDLNIIKGLEGSIFDLIDWQMDLPKSL